MKRQAYSIAVCVICLILAALHAVTAVKIDAVTVSLLLIAALPWLSAYVSTVKAGGVELSLRELQAKVRGNTEKIDEHDERIRRQQELINRIAISSLSDFLFFHLRELYRRQYRGDPSPYNLQLNNNDPMKQNLQMLMDLNLLGYFDISAMPHGADISKAAHLTEIGKTYVELRDPRIVSWTP